MSPHWSAGHHSVYGPLEDLKVRLDVVARAHLGQPLRGGRRGQDLGQAARPSGACICAMCQFPRPSSRVCYAGCIVVWLGSAKGSRCLRPPSMWQPPRRRRVVLNEINRQVCVATIYLCSPGTTRKMQYNLGSSWMGYKGEGASWSGPSPAHSC